MPSPELIHPALWRATQLARGAARGVPTGHAALSAQLPGGGWPPGTLIELLAPHPGVGEIRLLQPALAQLDTRHAIALVQPPHVPHLACWQAWRLDPRQLLWVAPQRPTDALWAAEQILKHGSCGALLCWLPRVRAEALRRLHLAAQDSGTLCFALRPATAAQQASPSPLRLALAPAPGGLSVHILKRRGPACAEPLNIIFEPSLQPASAPPHDPLDRRLPALPAAGRRTPAMAS
ncbi:translesion DNA synthesis-associated protein ImuA [Bordetella petrii]|uniref:translesion DNA synthesis-associated protein ImuA n=1 Tax=Bordetella petrii TaxID=94624 RepID=UPI001E299DBA|nr:translesion DNA synthesis-associated protein ImuA [Bordetella petrii]MCD0506150.1 translesion DNA synthesis-associated protein ImuA [Bordetella petrii]